MTTAITLGELSARAMRQSEKQASRLGTAAKIGGGLIGAAGLYYGGEAATSQFINQPKLRDDWVFKPTVKALENRITTGNLPVQTPKGDRIIGSDNDYMNELKGPSWLGKLTRPSASWRALTPSTEPYLPQQTGAGGTPEVTSGVDPKTFMPYSDTKTTERTSGVESWQEKLPQVRDRAEKERERLALEALYGDVGELARERGADQAKSLASVGENQDEYRRQMRLRGVDADAAVDQNTPGFQPPTEQSMRDRLGPIMSQAQGGPATPTQAAGAKPPETISELYSAQDIDPGEKQQRIQLRVAKLTGILAAETRGFLPPGVRSPEVESAQKELDLFQQLRGIGGQDEQDDPYGGPPPTNTRRDTRPGREQQYDLHNLRRRFEQ